MHSGGRQRQACARCGCKGLGWDGLGPAERTFRKIDGNLRTSQHTGGEQMVRGGPHMRSAPAVAGAAPHHDAATGPANPLAPSTCCRCARCGPTAGPAGGRRAGAPGGQALQPGLGAHPGAACRERGSRSRGGGWLAGRYQPACAAGIVQHKTATIFSSPAPKAFHSPTHPATTHPTRTRPRSPQPAPLSLQAAETLQERAYEKACQSFELEQAANGRAQVAPAGPAPSSVGTPMVKEGKASVGAVSLLAWGCLGQCCVAAARAGRAK